MKEWIANLIDYMTAREALAQGFTNTGAMGSLTKSSATKLASKKPGTGTTGTLKSTINFQVHGEDTVGIGSPMVYAGTFNYGAKSGEFGFGMYATRQGSFPIPWGDIPAR